MRIDPREWLPEELEAEDYLLLSAVFLLPWAFGGVEMWAYRSASLLVAVAASAALWKRGLQGLGLGRRIVWLLPAFLLAGWAVFQIVPLPSAVLRLLSPRADAMYRNAYPGYPGGPAGGTLPNLEKRALDLVPEAQGIHAPPDPEGTFSPAVAGRWSGARTLSLQPDATVERLFWFVALLLAFLTALERSSGVAWLSYRRVLFTLFGALAACGILQSLTWNGKLLWVRTLYHDGYPFGPYVNPTHFAGVMELAVPWLAGQAWMDFRRNRGKSWRGASAPLTAGVAFLCFVAAIAAASRMAALLIALGLTVLLLCAKRTGRWRLWGPLAIAGSWGVGALLLGYTRLGDRVRFFLEGSSGGIAGNSRLLAWKASLPVLHAFPITGTGFGTFRYVFPAYLPPGEILEWFQVHNDYLEVLLEGGAVAAALLAWLLVAYWRQVFRGKRGVALVSSPGRLGMLIGVASLSVHGLVDFNHQIPANALLFVVISAMALAATRREASR